MVLADTTARRPPNAEQMWGERIQIAEKQGMDALVEGTLARWFTEPYRSSRKDVMERIGNHIRSTPVAGFVGCCHAISKVDVLDRLGEIKCPALVIVGEEDHGTPPEMARAIHANLPGSELVLIPNAAHFSNVEQEKAFNDAMMAFLDRVR
jgi:3-oxoadipate enol-lactonase